MASSPYQVIFDSRHPELKRKDENWKLIYNSYIGGVQFQEAGYELVANDTVKVGDKRVNSATSEGSVKQLSVGQGTKAYLMRIKKEWFDEDQKEKQTKVSEIERATQDKALSGTYGTIESYRGSR